MNRNSKITTGVVAATLGLLALGASAFADGPRDRGGRHGGGQPMMQMLQRFDTDGDRALAQAEIDAGIAAEIVAADADGDGALDLAEFGTVWDRLTETARVRAFQRLDPNGDASITAAELDERFGDVVARMDRNDDGQLDRADRGRGEGRRGRGEGRRGERRGAPQQEAPAPAQ